jgi:hypothetical protein
MSAGFKKRKDFFCDGRKGRIIVLKQGFSVDLIGYASGLLVFFLFLPSARRLLVWLPLAWSRSSMDRIEVS